jgi:hypothetical protein
MMAIDNIKTQGASSWNTRSAIKTILAEIFARLEAVNLLEGLGIE